MSLLLPALLALTAHAAEPDPADPVDARPVVRAAVTELDLDGATVEGELYRPGNQLVAERPKARASSAIHLRANFDDVAVECAEQVR